MNISQMLKKYHAEIAYIKLEKAGYLARGRNGKPNIIFINPNLSDEEAENVIIHELGHLKHDHDLAHTYQDNYNSRIICEDGANKFMISQKVKEYVDLGYDVTNANWVNLAQYIGTDNYYFVREELLKYEIK